MDVSTFYCPKTGIVFEETHKDDEKLGSPSSATQQIASLRKQGSALPVEDTQQLDLIALINKFYSSHKNYYKDTAKYHDPIDLKKLSKLMDDPNKNIFVLRNGTKIIGTITLLLPPNKSCAKMDSLAVEAGVEGQEKLAYALINHVEQVAAAKGKSQMKLEVFRFHSNSIKHFEQAGYSLTGNERAVNHPSALKEAFQTPGGKDLLEMAKDL